MVTGKFFNQLTAVIHSNIVVLVIFLTISTLNKLLYSIVSNCTVLECFIFVPKIINSLKIQGNIPSNIEHLICRRRMKR